MKHFLILCIILLNGWLGLPSASVAAEERLIAVVMANSHSRYQDIHAAFVENAQPFCSDSCKIYVQTPNADVMSLRNSVRKAVALGAELIVTYGPSASLAAQAESPPMPTLFADVYDPVQLGLVSAKTQTGRNMTGIRGDAPIQALFKYFVETTKPKKLAVLYDTNSQEGRLQKAVLEESGKKRGITIIALATESAKDHITSLKTLPDETEGLFLTNSEHPGEHLDQVLKYAESRQLPVITQHAGAAESGAFMVLETSVEEQGEKLAEMAGLVLSGTAIKDMPVRKPRDVAFVVNLKVAKEYGINVPFQTLSVASRVVH